jgi:hypothetical protein
MEYLAECLWPGVSEAAIAELDTRVRETTHGDVRYLGSTLIPEDEVVFFAFEGPSADDIRAVAEQAEIPFERIVESVRIADLTKRGER